MTPEPEKRYSIKEIFYSLQGEGVRAGTPNVFVRFAGCNFNCKLATHGFDCDTDFAHGEKMTAAEILRAAEAELAGNGLPPCDLLQFGARSVIFTGGEPMLQLDTALAYSFQVRGFYLAIETNGSIAIPMRLRNLLDWICVSPKCPEADLKVLYADELKYVIAAGGELPTPRAQAEHYQISPAADGDRVPYATIQWCIAMVKRNPRWRLSVQQHKAWGVR